MDAASGQSKAAASCVHSAADLLWTDGLDSIRQLFVKGTNVSTDSQLLGASFDLETLHDVAWYCAWKEFGGDTSFLLPAPKVRIAELCAGLGVPVAKQPEAMQQLRQQDLQLLQQVVLPEYLMGVVTMLDAQLPGLDILARGERNELFME